TPEVDLDVVLIEGGPELRRVGGLDVQEFALAVAVNPHAQGVEIVEIEWWIKGFGRPGPRTLRCCPGAGGRVTAAGLARLRRLGGRLETGGDSIRRFLDDELARCAEVD